MLWVFYQFSSHCQLSALEAISYLLIGKPIIHSGISQLKERKYESMQKAGELVSNCVTSTLSLNIKRFLFRAIYWSSLCLGEFMSVSLYLSSLFSEHISYALICRIIMMGVKYYRGDPDPCEVPAQHSLSWCNKVQCEKVSCSSGSRSELSLQSTAGHCRPSLKQRAWDWLQRCSLQRWACATQVPRCMGTSVILQRRNPSLSLPFPLETIGIVI